MLLTGCRIGAIALLAVFSFIFIFMLNAVNFSSTESIQTFIGYLNRSRNLNSTDLDYNHTFLVLSDSGHVKEHHRQDEVSQLPKQTSNVVNETQQNDTSGKGGAEEEMPEEKFLAFCRYFRLSNRYKQITRALKVASQSNRSLILEGYYEMEFDEILDIEAMAVFLNERANSSHPLRVLSIRKYLEEGHSNEVDDIWCYAHHCGGIDQFDCPKLWPAPNGGTRNTKKWAHVGDLTEVNAKLLVLEGGSLFHFRQDEIANFFAPYAQKMWDTTLQYLSVNFKQKPGTESEPMNSMGWHFRTSDLAYNYNVTNFIKFIHMKVADWKINAFFIGTDANKERRAELSEMWPWAMMRTDPLCEGSDANYCVCYDQVAMASMDYFIGSPGSTFTDRIMDMRYYRAHRRARFDYWTLDTSTGVKYEEGKYF